MPDKCPFETWIKNAEKFRLTQSQYNTECMTTAGTTTTTPVNTATSTITPVNTNSSTPAPTTISTMPGAGVRTLANFWTGFLVACFYTICYFNS